MTRGRDQCAHSHLRCSYPQYQQQRTSLSVGEEITFRQSFIFVVYKHQEVINHPGGCSKPHFLFLSVRVSFISTSGHITAGNYKVLINSEIGEIRVIRARTFISNHRFTF